MVVSIWLLLLGAFVAFELGAWLGARVEQQSPARTLWSVHRKVVLGLVRTPGPKSVIAYEFAVDDWDAISKFAVARMLTGEIGLDELDHIESIKEWALDEKGDK